MCPGTYVCIGKVKASTSLSEEKKKGKMVACQRKCGWEALE